MKDRSIRHSMHLATCTAWVLVQLLVSTTVLAQPSNDPEVVVPRTGATQPLPEVTTPTPPPMPRRPQPGDKLGYSKEESTRLLDPEVRQLLDALLRLYREPGLFTDRRVAMQVLGVTDQRVWSSTTGLQPGEPAHYANQFAKTGIFGRPGWSGRFAYFGWFRARGEEWLAEISIEVDRTQVCIDSRAVEGYVDLFLQTGLDGRPHPLPVSRWDRHGIFGSPYALPLGPQTPRFSMSFASGCLVKIVVGNLFKFTEVSDEKVRD